MSFATASIGHNEPPSPMEEFRLSLVTADVAKLIARKDELLGSAARAPEIIVSDEVAGKVGDLIKLIMAAHKAAETARTNAKEPHLEAGRAVDGFYKGEILDPLDRAKRTLQGPLSSYLEQKALAARRAAEAEARRQREESERLASEAAAKADDNKMDEAVVAETRAIESEVMAQAKPAELSQTRGDYGSVSGLRTTWDYEITDVALVPRYFLMVNDVTVRAHIKARHKDQPPLATPGLRFFTKNSAVVR